MKKLAIISSLLFFNVIAQAQSTCLGEAQLIAQVDRLQSDNAGSCKIIIKDVSFYAANQLCRLELSEIMAEGIEIGITDGQCTYSLDNVSSLVVRTEDGKIKIE